MTEPGEDVKPSRPWQWPSEWAKDEKFWKDVASRTVSGVLAVGIIYIYGLAVGYFRTPQIVGTTLAAIGLAGMALFLIILGVIMFRGNKITGNEKFWRPFNALLIGSGITIMIGMVFIAATTDWSMQPDPFSDFLLFEEPSIK